MTDDDTSATQANQAKKDIEHDESKKLLGAMHLAQGKTRKRG